MIQNQAESAYNYRFSHKLQDESCQYKTQQYRDPLYIAAAPDMIVKVMHGLLDQNRHNTAAENIRGKSADNPCQSMKQGTAFISFKAKNVFKKQQKCKQKPI